MSNRSCSPPPEGDPPSSAQGGHIGPPSNLHIQSEKELEPRAAGRLSTLVVTPNAPHLNLQQTMGPGSLLLGLTLLFLLLGRPSSSAFAWTAFRDPAGVTCEASSYNSATLRCSWEALRPATVRLHLRQKGELGTNCSSQEVRSGRGPAWVQMVSCPSACSSAAEETPMELEVEAGGNGGQRQHLSRSLLWRDLVKPAAPEGLWVHQEERTGQVRLRWAPPSTWDRPTSFFPLRFHLHLEYFGNLDKGVHHQDLFSDHLEETAEPPQPHQILHRAKVRCQDPIAGSAWGPWSGWALPSETTPLP